MGDFFDRHPVISVIIICVLLAALIAGAYYGVRCLKNGVFNGNRQVVDTVWGYAYGIVKQANGEVVEGEVKSWLDFDESDMIQVTFADNKTYLVHSVNATLRTE